MAHPIHHTGFAPLTLAAIAGLSCFSADAGAGAQAAPDAPAAPDGAKDHAPPAHDGSRLVHLSLVCDHSAVVPGGSATVGVRLQVEKHWHVYWKNAGDSGAPIGVEFKLADEHSASLGALGWPVPTRLVSPGDIVDYVYENEVVLTAPITISASVKAGDVIKLHADVSWLVCDKVCLPGEGAADLTIQIGAQNAASSAPDEMLVKNSLSHQPRPTDADPSSAATGKQPIPAMLTPPTWRENSLLFLFPGPGTARFFPEAGDSLATPANQATKCETTSKDAVGALLVPFEADQAGKRVKGVLEVPDGPGGWRAWEVDVPGFTK